MDERGREMGIGLRWWAEIEKGMKGRYGSKGQRPWVRVETDLGGTGDGEYYPVG